MVFNLLLAELQVQLWPQEDIQVSLLVDQVKHQLTEEWVSPVYSIKTVTTS